MTEDFLQYFWQHIIPLNETFQTTDGKNLIILTKGQKNTDAGPDFFNAKLKIDGQIWAGNVEVHIKSSDWEKHLHEKDAAYNNVILHVVHKFDKNVKTLSGNIIPCLELPDLNKHYQNFQNNFVKKDFIPCEAYIKKTTEFDIYFWLEKVMVERWEIFYENFEIRLSANKKSWEETFYQILVQNFGLKINKEPFEQLSRSLPLKTLLKHKNSLLQIEALLFGQAGMLLTDSCTDNYFIKLSKEYQFLKHKYKLKHIAPSQWKYLRLRPANFPTIRIAQLAALIFKSSSLFSNIIEADSLSKLNSLLQVKASEYWETYYNFGKISKRKSVKRLGEQMQNLMLINSVLPTIFAYGLHHSNNELKERALDFLNQLPKENNSIIRGWENIGIKSKSAFYSQSLLQLKKKYCNFNRCLECHLGHQIFKSLI